MFRIKEYSQGWIVEIKVHVFLGFYKWKPLTHYSGLPDKPFYYSTPIKAKEGALQQISDDIRLSFFKI